MSSTLLDLLPGAGEPADGDTLLGRFLDYVTSRGLTLYPAQEEALLEIFAGRNVILNTPTGSGKSLVAMALHFHSLAQGRRSVYTCPIKALVNEKWRDLCAAFGPDNVGLATGDATVNRAAPILCCTAEILSNLALREGSKADVGDVVMDEFHFYADRERGVAWQVPLLTMPDTRFLLMSATLGETAFFQEELTRLNRWPTATISSSDRPVPLEFSYSETPLAEAVAEMVAMGKAPIYVVHFTQRDAADSAQSFTSQNVASREEKARIAEMLEGFRFSSPYGAEVKKLLRHGLGLHHAGMLPKYRVLTERLAQAGLLKVICGTDTLGVGVNVPIRTVLFTRLFKFSGERTAILSARDFHQVSGRAGRKGFDDRGWVVAQAPEHVIENIQLEKKGKKFVKRRPPEKKYVVWDEATFTRLQAAPPERLTSRFQVTHGMLLNVLSRPGDGCRAMRELIRFSHETPTAKAAHLRRGWQLFRALLDRGIVEIIPQTADGAKVRVNVALQDDFSMNQTLSLYVHDTLPLLDPQAPDYALRVLTLVESILEDPDIILRRQLDRVKTDKLVELKAQGMEFDQRIEELEKLEYPKPDRDFIYETFNAFAAKHPWVGQENIRAKSVAREMWEDFRSFADYVKIYELQRAEGVLLRHLSSVHKALAQTVPDAAKDEEVREIEAWLGAMLRQVDSSLLDEWERMRNPDAPTRDDEAEVRPPGAEAEDITRNERAFVAAMRAHVFAFLRSWWNGDWDDAVALSGSPEAAEPWTVERLRKAREEFEVAHGRLRLDPEARNRRHTHLPAPEDPRTRRIEQMLIDTEEANDWSADWEVDMTRSRERAEPAMRLMSLGLFRA